VIRFTRKQAEAKQIAERNTITLYGGAIRGGKTWWLILMIWVWALRYPKSRWVIIRNSFSTLQQTTLVTFQTLLDDGLANDVVSWKQQTHTATLYNGSQVFFMAESFDSDKELNRFKGLEINGAGFDELNECQEATFNKTIERAGSWQHSPGCPIRILATCNPTKNWVKQRFYDRWVEGTLPSRWAYVPAKITDNRHISKEYIESLQLLPIFEYKCFVDGDWEAVPRTGGEFYKLFDYGKNVSRDIKYDPAAALHITWDFNVAPYMTLCIWQLYSYEVRDASGKLLLKTKKLAKQIDEITLRSPKNRTEDVCKEFIDRYGSHEAGVFVYGDPAGKHEDTRTERGSNDYTIIMRELRQFHPSQRVASVAPNVVMRGKFFNQVFQTGYEGLEILIAAKCKDTIDDYLYLLEAPEGGKAKVKTKDAKTGVSFEKHGHTSDANDYLICFAYNAEFSHYQKSRAVPQKLSMGKGGSRNRM
jgi:hypothetical protein